MGFKRVNDNVIGEKMDEKIDNKDFSRLVDSLDTHRFGVEMHLRLMDETNIVMGEQSQFDMVDINRILANYPRYFSWIIVESEVLNEVYLKAQRDFDDWYKTKYSQATDSLMGKSTINAIEAKVVQICAEEKIALHKKLNKEGYTEQEISEMLRYEGLDGKQNKVMEYQAKANIAKGMVKVWSNAIHSLQSLSKNITTEFELVKRQVGG